MMKIDGRVQHVFELIHSRNVWARLPGDQPRDLEKGPCKLAKSCQEAVSINGLQATICWLIDGALMPPSMKTWPIS